MEIHSRDNRPKTGNVHVSHWVSLIVCVVSTVFYCTSNIILRELTALRVDYDWALTWKELLGLVALLPWLLFRQCQGRYRFVSKRLILWLFAGGFVCEMFGARLQMYAYMTVGILIAAPLIQAASMGGTAVLGTLCLRDPLSVWKKIAMGVLLVAVTVLLIGKNAAPDATPRENIAETMKEAGARIPDVSAPDNSEDRGERGRFTLFLAGLGAVFAGICYSVHMVIVRFAGHRHWDDERYHPWESMRFRHWIGYDRKERHDVPGASAFYSPFPVTLIMGIIFFVGVLSFGGCLVAKSPAGFSALLTAPLDAQPENPLRCWILVGVSGLCNTLGFFFQVQGLRMTSAAQVSLVAVSQFVFLALFGMLFFGEPTNWLIWTGVALTAAGVLLSAKR